MSQRVMVRYHVLVYAQVDVAHSEVTRVIVDDEHMSGPDTLGGLTDGETGVIIDRDTAARAVEIAQQKEWPAWEFGF